MIAKKKKNDGFFSYDNGYVDHRVAYDCLKTFPLKHSDIPTTVHC